MSPRTLERWRFTGEGPQFVKLGGRVIYRLEDIEAYDLDILRNGAVVRTIAMTSASAIYPAAQETLDFGSAQSAFDVQAYQKSAAVGRGFPLTAHVAV